LAELPELSLLTPPPAVEPLGEEAEPDAGAPVA
jgi:hypothetical protein